MGVYKYHLVAPVKKQCYNNLCHLVCSIYSNFIGFNLLQNELYNGLSFNDILNWKGVYLVEYTCIPNDTDKNNNIKHCVVVDGSNKCVYDINYGCIKYQNLNLCNYYFDIDIE